MSKKVVLAVLLIAAGLPVTKRAQADDEAITPAGPYAGLGWGRFGYDINNLNDVGTAVTRIVHSSDDAFKANVGFRFSQYFSVEGDYMNFGTPGDNFQATGANGNYRIHMSGFAPFGVLTLPVGPIELFGKAGDLFYDTDLRVYLNQPGQKVFQSTHSRSDFIFGGGLGVTVIQHLNFSLEYDAVRLQNAPNSNVPWLNVAWRF